MKSTIIVLFSIVALVACSIPPEFTKKPGNKKGVNCICREKECTDVSCEEKNCLCSVVRGYLYYEKFYDPNQLFKIILFSESS